MAEDTPSEVDLDRVAEIVSSYVRHHQIAPEELPALIAQVHQALAGLRRAAPAQDLPAPAVSIRRSVHQDYVVCLECGYVAQMLRRHLRVAHGLEAADYRTRWQLPPDHPLTAPGYSARRSTMARGDRSRAPHQRKTEPGGNRTGSGGGTTGIRDWSIAAKHPAGRSPAEAPATVMMSTILGALAVIWPGLAPKERLNKGLVHNWRGGYSSLATARGRWF